MSYCRWGEADVYVFSHYGGWIECCGCSLNVDQLREGELFPPPFKAKTTDEMIEHLDRHREASDFVPDSVYEAIRDEQRYGLDEELAEIREKQES